MMTEFLTLGILFQLMQTVISMAMEYSIEMNIIQIQQQELQEMLMEMESMTCVKHLHLQTQLQIREEALMNSVGGSCCYYYFF